MIFVNANIPAKLISAEVHPTESMFFELNCHKKMARKRLL